MQKLFSSKDKKFLPQVNESELALQQFIWNNRKELFRKYTFIKDEFPLNEGQVHDSGKMGRIDILAYNPGKQRFVIFELKRDDGKGRALYQALKYRQYIKKHFPVVRWDVLEKYNVSIPQSAKDNKAEIILIAKEFTQPVIDEADENENLITLIKYNWFENDLILLDYVNNAPVTSQGGQKPTSKEATITDKHQIPSHIRAKIDRLKARGWQGIVKGIGSKNPDPELKEFREQMLNSQPTKKNAPTLRASIKNAPKSVHYHTRAALLELLDEKEHET